MFRDQLTTSAYAEHGWDYYSAIPTDTLRVLALVDTDTSWRYLAPRIEWVVENGNILCNHEDPYLLYMKAPDVVDMDSLFVQALYTLLASKLAIPLGGDGGKERKRELYEEFLNVIMPEARRVDGFESNEIETIDSEWLAAIVTNQSTIGQSWPPFAAGLDLGSYSW